MKKRSLVWSLVAILLAGFFGLAHASTNVGGPIFQDTIWGRSGSPYIVTGNIIVFSGFKLTIEPGVVVKFNKGFAFQVNGVIVANGDKSNPILFTSNLEDTGPGDWGHILLDGAGTDGSSFKYVTLEYAGGSTESASLRLKSCHAPTIENCTIRYGGSQGIVVTNLVSELKITDTTVSNNNWRGIYVERTTSTISGCTVSNNTISTTSSDGGAGIYSYDSNITISDSTISNNILKTNGWGRGGGIYIVYNRANIVNNKIMNNEIASQSDHAVGGGVTTLAATTVIKCNYIKGNSAIMNGGGWTGGGGIREWDGDTDILDNVIIFNTANKDGGGISDDGNATITNNIISDNSSSGSAGMYTYRSSGSITNNSFIRNGSNAWSSAVSFDYDRPIFQYNTVVYNKNIENTAKCTIYVQKETIPTINYNNIFSNAPPYDLYNDNASGYTNVNAKNNWWGTGNAGEVHLKIFDWIDDNTKGFVDYMPILPAISTDTPVSPPAGLTATINDSNVITLSWNSNPEPDVAGYRVYWDGDGYPYDHVVDVGMQTSHVIQDPGPSSTNTWYVAVTAYDGDYAEEVDDLSTIVNECQTKGNESWFTEEKKMTSEQPPVADFSGTPLSGPYPLKVKFSNLSKGMITGFQWDFGDGQTTTEKNPVHEYAEVGTYTVTLTVTGPGGTNTKTRDNYVNVTPPPAPVVFFSGIPTSGRFPLTVQFTDLSKNPVTSWSWDFGDGQTSAEQHPSHVYSSPGKYSVALTATGPGGTGSKARPDYITVLDVAPVADFTATPTSGTLPLTVSFTDISQNNVTSWLWNFGDGTTGKEQNPVHTYNKVGKFTVTLTISGSGGKDTEAKKDYITVKDIARPDLVVKSITVPGSAINGVPFKVSDVVMNRGKEAADAFTVGIYLSKNTVINPKEDILIGKHDRTDLKAGQSAPGTATVTIPDDVKPGKYYIGALADMRNAVQESNESNNTVTSSKVVKVDVQRPDLVVSDVTVPASAKIGQPFDALVNVKNKGQADAANFSLEVYLSGDAVFQPEEDIALGSVNISILRANAQLRKPVEAVIPAGTAAGKFYVIAVVDGENSVGESNEDNNSMASQLTIQVTK